MDVSRRSPRLSYDRLQPAQGFDHRRHHPIPGRVPVSWGSTGNDEDPTMRRLQFGALAIPLLAWRDARKSREATPPEAEARHRESWLRGSSDEKFEQLEKQLRGFDK